jgi:phage shock protein PspC (stress-responsive transcriptional regulator)
MSSGATGNRIWIGTLAGGSLLIIATMLMQRVGLSLHGLHTTLLGIGGLLVVFAACELMILAVDGIGQRLRMNRYVAGTMAGLASNIPELVMLAFVLAATPRVGFLVTVVTLHVSAAAFGIYSALLPRDERGNAAMPRPLVLLSTDLYACAAGVFFATGAIMLLMHVFDAGTHQGEALNATDLYVLGAALLLVEVVAIVRLVKRFSGEDSGSKPKPATAATEGSIANEPPSLKAIYAFAALGIVASVFGGHAVGEFADVLVGALDQAGYPKMVGALVLSVFASAGALVMMASAHAKGMYDVALANASGQVTQVPFVVLPIALILLAAFSQTGVIPLTPSGGVLPIDLDTVSVLFLAFPSMLILWKAIQDDGTVNWLETVTMVVIFGLAIYFLAAHG